MKTITTDEFVTLVAGNDWNQEQNIEIGETFERPVYNRTQFGSQTTDWVNEVTGTATKTSKMGDVIITYTEDFKYNECNTNSFRAGAETRDDVWTLEGISVVDEYDDILVGYELTKFLPPAFSKIDYSDLEIEQIADVEPEKDENPDTLTLLEIDNAPFLKFYGTLIGSAVSPKEGDRWTELKLYKTKGGKFVCHSVGLSKWANERTRFSGKVCETEAEVIEFFGHRWLAKELYAEAGISDVLEIQ